MAQTRNLASNDRSKQQNALRILIWLAKALVLRADPQVNTILDPLLDLLSHPSLGPPTARAFAILLAPDDLICKDNHAVIRLLHKQRLFDHCVPRLVEGLRQHTSTSSPPSQEARPNYLIALSSLLQHVSLPVISPHLEVLVPLLLQSLDLSDPQVRAATVGTLTVTIRENATAVETHVSSLIARLLGCATGKGVGTPPVGFTFLPSIAGLDADRASSTASEVDGARMPRYIPEVLPRRAAATLQEGGEQETDGVSGRREERCPESRGGLPKGVGGDGRAIVGSDFCNVLFQ